MRRLLAKVMMSAALVGFAVSARPQQPEMPKPAPELKKLEYLVGKWKVEGEAKPGPMGPGGKFTGTDAWVWMEGGFYLVNHSKFAGGGMGEGSSIAFMGYDADKKM